MQNLEAPVLENQTQPVHNADELHVGVASTIDQVVEAWQLVYQLYRRIDIINENPIGLHTSMHAVFPNTSVVLGQLNGEVVSTMSVMHDSDYGLPLDRVYSRQLNMLRRLGRPLIEVGLLADRREKAGRALSAVMEMMRHTVWNAYYQQADIVCGVHPHHADFYIKAFGCDVIGPVLLYPTVRNRPVVLLRLDIQHQLTQQKLPRCLHQYFNIQEPLSRQETDGRGVLGLDSILDTPIARYLQYAGQINEHGLPTSPVPQYIWRDHRESVAA